MLLPDDSALPKRANPWRPLWGDRGFASFKAPVGTWRHATSVRLAAASPRLLEAPAADGGMIVNGDGKTSDLVTAENFGDLEVEMEFLLAKGSNSGVKLHGHYEVQLFDSFGKTKLDGTDCGGIYPRAELLPRYRHLDRGTAPRVNACKAPGEWQTLRIVFRAPRFDAGGKRTATARIERVELNGQTVQQDVELTSPTGHAWRQREVPAGPLLLQGDHGPVAFRNGRVRAPEPPPRGL